MGVFKLIIAALVICSIMPEGTAVEYQVLTYAILFAGWIAHKGGND